MGSKLIECIKNINDEVNKLKNFYKDDSYRIVFRGEDRDYGETRLTPTIFRNKNLLKKEKFILNTFNNYYVNQDFNNAQTLENAIEAQHYLRKTRLLDITFNVATAIFMALDPIITQKENIEINTNEKMKKELLEELNERIKGNPPVIYCIVADSILPYNSDLVKRVFDENCNESIRYLFIDNNKQNKRMIAQNGGFILYPDHLGGIPAMYQYEKIKIIDEKEHNEYDENINFIKIIEDIYDELNELFDIKPATMYPDDFERVKSYVDNLIDISNKKYVEDNIKEDNDFEIDYFLEEYVYKYIKNNLLNQEQNDFENYNCNKLKIKNRIAIAYRSIISFSEKTKKNHVKNLIKLELETSLKKIYEFSINQIYYKYKKGE